MAPSILYTACVIGAVAVYLLLRPGPRAAKAAGIVLGLGALGWVAKASVEALGGPDGAVEPFYATFSLIAVAAAVRLITHHRPVYAALYFVMVVLASAGLFLLLEAEFMAFALVIVYAGAILITYLFVLMLAQQAPTPEDEEGGRQPEYDVVPREPAAAVLVGFVLLALLAETIFGGVGEIPPPPAPETVRAEAWNELRKLPEGLDSVVRRHLPEQGEVVPGSLRVDGAEAYVSLHSGDPARSRFVPLPPEAVPDNIERVGLALIADFPVSLELAGVILLMAMYGAVVLARRQVEATEDQKRQAAGAGS